MKRLLFVFVLAGCAKQTTKQSIGAVCNRGKKIGVAAHTERVHVATDLKSLGADPIKRARVVVRCEGSTKLDVAAQDAFTVMLDAQIVHTSEWAPLSKALQSMVRSSETNPCKKIEAEPDASFSEVRAWAEQMQKLHDAAYEECRRIYARQSDSKP